MQICDLFCLEFRHYWNFPQTTVNRQWRMLWQTYKKGFPASLHPSTNRSRKAIRHYGTSATQSAATTTTDTSKAPKKNKTQQQPPPNSKDIKVSTTYPFSAQPNTRPAPAERARAVLEPRRLRHQRLHLGAQEPLPTVLRRNLRNVHHHGIA